MYFLIFLDRVCINVYFLVFIDIAGSGMATSPSVSAFSGVSSIPLDNEIDENLSPAQLATGNIKQPI